MSDLKFVFSFLHVYKFLCYLNKHAILMLPYIETSMLFISAQGELEKPN